MSRPTTTSVDSTKRANAAPIAAGHVLVQLVGVDPPDVVRLEDGAQVSGHARSLRDATGGQRQAPRNARTRPAAPAGAGKWALTAAPGLQGFANHD